MYRLAFTVSALTSAALAQDVIQPGGPLPTRASQGATAVPRSYIVTFAPGTFVSGQTLAQVQHNYGHVGKYHIRLTWRDQTGLSNEDNTLVVKVLPPQAIHPHKKR